MNNIPKVRGGNAPSATMGEELDLPPVDVASSDPFEDLESLYTHGVFTENLRRLEDVMGLRAGKHTADSVARIAVERFVGRPEAQTVPIADYQELRRNFIAAYAHFLRQVWGELKLSEADASRESCIVLFEKVKWSFDRYRVATRK